MRVFDQAVEIVQTPEDRLDAAVIGDVVAEVLHWRGKNGREPDRIDFQPLEVIEALADAVQVANAVAIRVLEGAWIDLIDDPAFPPRLFRHRPPRSDKSQESGKSVRVS